MKKSIISRSLWVAAVIVTLAACKKNNDISNSNEADSATKTMIAEQGNNPDEAAIGETAITLAGRGGRQNGQYLYTETNEAGLNAILIFKVAENGRLEPKGSVASGGTGTGKTLGSQGALAISEDGDWLFAVNAGDNSVSSFEIANDGELKLKKTVTTKGVMPVSVTVYNNLLYVLNRGTDNINGFHIGDNGKLTFIEGSKKILSSKAVDAPQIAITPDGKWVIVTEKATNTVGTFKIKHDGSVEAGKFSAAAGPTPFGFYFSGNYMIVSNAAGGAAGAGSATSNIIRNDGSVTAVNGIVRNQQAAPCWVTTTKYGRFAYVSNTSSNTISSYYVSPFGRLYLVNATAGTTNNGAADIVVTADNCKVYSLTSGAHIINGFRRKLFGELESTFSSAVLPVSTSGLATK